MVGSSIIARNQCYFVGAVFQQTGCESLRIATESCTLMNRWPDVHQARQLAAILMVMIHLICSHVLINFAPTPLAAC